MNILFQDLSLAIYKHAFVPNVFHFKLMSSNGIFLAHFKISMETLCNLVVMQSHVQGILFSVSIFRV